jgi:hypothetical protein
MKKEKKPDNIVFDESSETYNSKVLPYASNLSAPKIVPPDITTWKNTNIVSANNLFKAKHKAIKEQYQALMEAYELNRLVYESKISFEPIVGKVYHLYRSKDQSTFLSLISPNECNFEHLGSFKLEPDKVWSKV